jgi:hypothetical protein
MPNDKTLPPLPSSDERSISSNRFDPFYRVRAREFWGDNEIHTEIPEKFKKCIHYFVPKPGAAECKKCSFGLMGIFEVQKGKLYYKGKAIKL